MTFNVWLNVSKCSETCDDGYLASLDSVYVWNIELFPYISYSEFIFSLQQEYNNSLPLDTQTAPFAIFN